MQLAGLKFEDVNKVLAYLSTKPYSEVVELVNLLSKPLIVNVEDKKPEPEVKSEVKKDEN